MENTKPLVLAAVIAAAASLILSVIAIVEIYTPPRIVAIAPLGISSRLTLLEKMLVAQEETMAQIQATQVSTPYAVQKNETEMKSLREAVQTVLSQVGNEISAIHSQIGKLEEQSKQQAATKVARAAQPLASKTGASPYLTHRAATGETLTSIAEKYSVAEEDIVSINPPWLDFSHLNAGQTIYVPRQ